MTAIATLRIDEETKRKLKRYGISVSKVARSALQREIERREREDALKAVKRMKEIVKDIDVKKVVEHIREDRTRR